jgi:hypothetical protein
MNKALKRLAVNWMAIIAVWAVVLQLLGAGFQPAAAAPPIGPFAICAVALDGGDEQPGTDKHKPAICCTVCTSGLLVGALPEAPAVFVRLAAARPVAAPLLDQVGIFQRPERHALSQRGPPV